MSDTEFMRRALALAGRGKGYTSPNPAVGAVLVRGGEVIGEGYHREFGAPHAEIEAIRSADNAAGAVLYVTLEPCCFTGKTPPCTDAIKGSGIRSMVLAMRDPNPEVSGRGVSGADHIPSSCLSGHLLRGFCSVGRGAVLPGVSLAGLPASLYPLPSEPFRRDRSPEPTGTGAQLAACYPDRGDPF